MGLNVHAPDVLVTDGKVALDYLKEGNKRFVNNELMPRSTNKVDIAATKDKQKPFAVVLTCSDSRVPPELFFDQKIGDIFVIRNAGNFADQTALGSIEYAVGHLKAPLVAVVGHSMCGAVYTAHSGATGFSENLQTLLSCVKANITGSATKEEAIGDNVKAIVADLKKNEVIKKENALVVGAEYDLATGMVSFL
ncbi:MAG: hypothetical protein FWG92_06280 [Leptospirales bacterium]|nr:hypothetical protein [Leptospirales bacterium]